MTQTMATLLLFLVVVIVVLVLGRCPPPANETAYQKFLRQHYNKCGMGTKDCPSVMSKRCMGKPCKEKNSFVINTTPKQIQDVCGKGGKPLSGNLRQSTSPFEVLTCKRRASSVIGFDLDSLEVVAERRMRSKLEAIMDNFSHPLFDRLAGMKSTFSNRLIHPRCDRERYRRSFLPSAIRLYNASTLRLGRGNIDSDLFLD
ncbi:ANG4 protein, partial [Atractosteus spatula]|nr:ANG4 protein [Atractosteus spatula]